MEIKGKVVFSSGKQGDYDIWTLDLTSKEIKQLTSGSFWNDCPKWSPDGKKILFISNRTETPEIWIMDENGGNQVRVTNTGRWHNTPDWSRDGKQIVFCANYDGNIDVYTMNIDGSGLVQITDYEGMDFNPQFSPDSKKIIFTSQRSGNDDIWTYDLETKETKQLTTYENKDFSPAYSPDGSLIAFVCQEVPAIGEENLEIYLMDKEGINRRRITHNSGTDRYVSWSPNGESLIYTSSKARTTAERLKILDVTDLKSSNIDYDRTPLENEIDATTIGFGIFSIFPAAIVKKFYDEAYFGTERFPDWKY
jgi:TolB protein